MAGRLTATLLLVLAVAAGAPAGAEGRDAELVTVTDRGFAATWWTPEPGPSTVCFGPERPSKCRTDTRLTRAHHVEVDKLQAGRRYVYALRSGPSAEPVSATNPGSFTTLRRPPGRHLFDFALLSDIHIGEKCSGTATSAGGSSVPPCFSAEQHGPYARIMAEAAVDAINRRGVDLVVVNADNTTHGEYADSAGARAILDRLRAPYAIARGPHDRPGQNDPPDPRCGVDEDCFRAVFFPDRPPGRVFHRAEHGDHVFIGLDSSDPATGVGDLTDAAQNEFLERELAAARDAGRRAWVFFHHPATEYATTFAVPPAVFGVQAQRGQGEFLRRLARFPNVVGVLNAHTHRNFVSYAPATGRAVPFVENGPAKEYPGGFSVFRVFEGGYMRNFHRLACDYCLAWSGITRGEYYGLYPLYTLGTLAARNFTHLYDCSEFTPPPSPPTGPSGDTAPSSCRTGEGGEEPGAGGGRPPSGARPRLRVSVRPRRVRTRRRVSLRVLVRARRDGRLRPVRGAAVRVAGAAGRTRAGGRVRLSRRFRRPGRYTVVARKRGHRRGRAVVRVAARARR